ncbi:MAG: BlaI/MecI/CopY family transcriptional regulator [Actinomycetota bacterium]|nr:BlaI/MecI/CopY family transcriptional regulator [Actinomycetota bacterium]
MASLGELERSVMEVLWSTQGALTANELREALAARNDAGRGVATTTMLTVLSRLERKGFVSRSRDMRPHRYRALLSREEHTAELMREVLDQSSDREAALARFVGTVSKGEAATLRRVLDELSPR